MDNSWVRDALKGRGYMQRDLAQAWGVSESAVSRWMAGTEQQDLPITRARSLSRMLGISLDELVDRLGFGSGEAPPPSTLAPPATTLPLGAINVVPANGKMRVQFHLTLDAETAGRLMALLGEASAI